jgi:hypothetical protein
MTRTSVALAALMLAALGTGCGNSQPATIVTLPNANANQCAAGMVRVRDGMHHFKCISEKDDTEHAVVFAPRVCEKDSDCERGEFCNTDFHALGHPTEGTCYLLH